MKFEKRQTVDDRFLCVVIMYVMAAAAMINYLYHDCPSHNWHVSWKIWVKLIINILTWMRLFVKVLGSPIWQAIRRGCLSRRRPPPLLVLKKPKIYGPASALPQHTNSFTGSWLLLIIHKLTSSLCNFVSNVAKRALKMAMYFMKLMVLKKG